MPSFFASRVLAAHVVRVHPIEEKRGTAGCLIKGLARDSFTNTFIILHAVVSRVKPSKAANKNVQLVLIHCCKTSEKAMLRALPPWVNLFLEQLRLL